MFPTPSDAVVRGYYQRPFLLTIPVCRTQQEGDEPDPVPAAPQLDADMLFESDDEQGGRTRQTSVYSESLESFPAPLKVYPFGSVPCARKCLPPPPGDGSDFFASDSEHSQPEVQPQADTSFIARNGIGVRPSLTFFSAVLRLRRDST